MILRRRPREASFSSIGKLTLDLCTSRLMKFARKIRKSVKSVADLWFLLRFG